MCVETSGTTRTSPCSAQTRSIHSRAISTTAAGKLSHKALHVLRHVIQGFGCTDSAISNGHRWYPTHHQVRHLLGWSHVLIHLQGVRWSRCEGCPHPHLHPCLSVLRLDSHSGVLVVHVVLFADCVCLDRWKCLMVTTPSTGPTRLYRTSMTPLVDRGTPSVSP